MTCKETHPHPFGKDPLTCEQADGHEGNHYAHFLNPNNGDIGSLDWSTDWPEHWYDP